MQTRLSGMNRLTVVDGWLRKQETWHPWHYTSEHSFFEEGKDQPQQHRAAESVSFCAELEHHFELEVQAFWPVSLTYLIREHADFRC